MPFIRFVSSPELLFSLCALIISVLSPILTGIINGRTQIRLKKIEQEENAEVRNHEFYEKHRAEVIEQYLKAASRRISALVTENDEAYYAALSELYLYVGEKHWGAIDKIHANVEKGTPENAFTELIKFCKLVSKTESVREKRIIGKQPDKKSARD